MRRSSYSRNPLLTVATVFVAAAAVILAVIVLRPLVQRERPVWWVTAEGTWPFEARPPVWVPRPGTPERQWVDSTLATLTLAGKAAQMVMPWVAGDASARPAELEASQRLARESAVGGFIVGRGREAEVRATIQALQAASPVPLLIGSDLEWGPGMRLSGAPIFPVAMALGATGDPRLAYAIGEATAKEALQAGIHMTFAPVADVNVNPANPIINVRAFGENPAAVAEMVAAFTRGAQDAGLLAVAKHFPGHGDTHTDSHLELPAISVSRQRLDSVELVPFRRAVREGVAGVMTAHIALPRITGTGTPSTLSREIITGVLREELEFGGLIITDALNMAGVTRFASQAEVVRMAVQAGADILLQPPDPAAAVRVIVSEVQSGRLSEARIDSSVVRILSAKLRVELDQGASQADPDPGERMQHLELAESAAARSITLLKDSLSLIPYSGRRVRVLVYSDGRSASHGVTIERTLLDAGIDVSVSRMSSSAAYDTTLIQGDADAGLLVFAAYTQAAPWRGTLGLPAPVADEVRRLAGLRPLVLISFGDPYLVRTVPGAAVHILAWSDAPVAEAAAAKALVGRASITGRSPISIPPLYRLGAGIRR